MTEKNKFKFPVGYQHFHEQENINFQLNRLILNGASSEEVKKIAPKIKDFNDWKRELVLLAEKAEEEDRKLNAAWYYRAAEFFVSSEDPDKEILYDKFIELFYDIYEEVVALKENIPYENTTLPSIHLKSKVSGEKKKGVVVLHGGYDSFLEELYLMGLYIRDSGYEVVLFEGPGQGGVLIKQELAMTPEWEKPVRAVLDHFNFNDINLIGLSLGGYLGLRAAAFESRITKVVAFDVIYDFFQVLLFAAGEKVRQMVESFLNSGKIKMLNKTMERVMQHDLLVNWGVNHGMHVFGVDTPYGYMEEARKYSTAEFSDKITCHVLLMAGTNDHFIPVEMFYRQIEALKNVKSLTCRLFTEQEHGANHCQYGNLQLALDFILNWMEIIK
ncbi:MAG: alpha/beta fold hydrolase [Candidatus Lokiarchaeota archaeon]|nr:alpha/beta fold hydrolase [Candidatus Lokiarchaeota archaeon]